MAPTHHNVSYHTKTRLTLTYHNRTGILVLVLVGNCNERYTKLNVLWSALSALSSKTTWIKFNYIGIDAADSSKNIPTEFLVWLKAAFLVSLVDLFATIHYYHDACSRLFYLFKFMKQQLTVTKSATTVTDDNLVVYNVTLVLCFSNYGKSTYSLIIL